MDQSVEARLVFRFEISYLFLKAIIQVLTCLDAKTSVQKCKVSVSVLLSQTFIPKYWYRFLKSGINATLMDRHSDITLVTTG